MGYISKHWRGEFPLAVSFWVNVFLVNIGITFISFLILHFIKNESPVLIAKITLALVFFSTLFIFPWQIVGTWKSATRHSKNTQDNFWSGFVRTILVLGTLVMIIPS